jgi:hypothetical protein
MQRVVSPKNQRPKRRRKEMRKRKAEDEDEDEVEDLPLSEVLARGQSMYLEELLRI